MSVFDRVKEFVATTKGKALLVVGTASATIVQYASAATPTLNESIGPILTSVVELFPSLLALVLAALPIIIAISVIGFILGLFDGILGKIRI